MAKFIVTAPDGKEYEITAPEGATQEQILEYAQANFPQATTAAPDMRAGRGTNRASLPSQQVLPDVVWSRLSPERQEAFTRSILPAYARGEPSSGFTAGIEDLPVGAMQLGANIFSLLQSGELATDVNQAVREREAQIEQSRALAGRGGIDLARLGGGLVSPANIPVSRALSLLRPSTTRTGDLAQAGATGGVVGGLQPATGEDFFGDKATQVGVGVLFGSVTKGAIDLVGKIGSMAGGLTGRGRQDALRNYVNELAGEDRDAVIVALQNAKEFVTGSRPTVGEVLSDLPGAIDLVAKQAKIATQPGLRVKFEKRVSENQAARVRELQKIAGTADSRARLANRRDRETGRSREASLDQANVAGPIYTRLEKEIADGFNSLAAAQQTAGQVGSAARTQELIAAQGQPGWLTRGDIASDAAGRAAAYGQKAETIRSNIRLKQYQQESLEKHGFFPLRASDLVDNIDGLIRNSKSDMAKQVLQSTKTNILSRADENGIVNSRDLYENVRKTLNQDIEKLLGQGDQFASGGLPQQAAKSAADIKKVIDASLNKTSGGLWSKYLTDYQKYSQKLDRMEVGQYLLNKLQQPGAVEGEVGLKATRVGAFATGVESAASTIKKATGQPRAERLDQILSPKEVLSVSNVLKDLTREQQAMTQGRGPAMEGGIPNVSGIVPPWFSASITVLKSALSAAQERGNAKFNRDLSELLLEPQKMAQFMSSVPENQATTLGRVFYDLADNNNKRLLGSLFTIPATAQSVGQPEEF